jgi:Putative metallopeptidase
MAKSPVVLIVMFLVCAGGVSGAAAQPSDAIRAFELRVERASQVVVDPSLRDLSPARRRGMVEFISGNMLFALLHEIGHAHISEMGLPVLGREEDAADSFAVVTMLKIGSTFSRNVLKQAALGWFLSALRDEIEKRRLAFFDSHGLDRQRAFQIVCLMVGSDPDGFRDLAMQVGLPEDRQDTCRGDFSNASWSWETLMKSHLRANGQPKTSIGTVYGKGKGDLKHFEDCFRAVMILEAVAQQAAEEYVWRRSYSLELQSCGTPGARWDLATQKVTLCYELAADYAQLYRKYSEMMEMALLR